MLFTIIDGWHVGVVYRSPADHSGRIYAAASSIIATMPTDARWILAGDYNDRAETTELPGMFNATLLAPKGPDGVFLPSRWCSHAAIDWLLTRHPEEVKTSFREERYSDHKATAVQLDAGDPQHVGYRMTPTRNLEPPAGVTKEEYKAALEQEWSDAYFNEVKQWPKCRDATEAQIYLNEMWEDLCLNIEEAMTRARTRWTTDDCRSKCRPKGSTPTLVRKSYVDPKRGSGCKLLRLQRLHGRLCEAIAGQRAVEKDKLGPRALQAYFRLTQGTMDTRIDGISITGEWEDDEERVRRYIEDHMAEATRQRVADWKARLQEDPAALRRWVNDKDAVVNSPSFMRRGGPGPHEVPPRVSRASRCLLAENLGSTTTERGRLPRPVGAGVAQRQHLHVGGVDVAAALGRGQPQRQRRSSRTIGMDFGGAAVLAPSGMGHCRRAAQLRAGVGNCGVGVEMRPTDPHSQAGRQPR